MAHTPRDESAEAQKSLDLSGPRYLRATFTDDDSNIGIATSVQVELSDGLSLATARGHIAHELKKAIDDWVAEECARHFIRPKPEESE